MQNLQLAGEAKAALGCALRSSMKAFVFAAIFCFFIRQIFAGDAIAIGYNVDGAWAAVTYNRSSTPKGGPHYHDGLQASAFALRDLYARTTTDLARAEIL